MSGYRWPIPPADRWAIIAHVRALQRERAARAPASAEATVGKPTTTDDGGQAGGDEEMNG